MTLAWRNDLGPAGLAGLTLNDGTALAPPHLRGGVLLLGNFDGLHRGHRGLLAAARRLAKPCRPVGIMSCEPHPRQVFDPDAPPFRVQCAKTKRYTFTAEGLDFLYQPRFDRAFAGQSPDAFAGNVLKDCLGVSAVVLGPDFRFGARRAGTAEWLQDWGRNVGVAVHIAEEAYDGDDRVSSSRVRACLVRGDFAAAAALLGQPWRVEVRVLARTGKSTLRLGWPEEVLRPPEGSHDVKLAAGDGRLTLGPIPETILTADTLPLGPLEANILSRKT